MYIVMKGKISDIKQVSLILTLLCYSITNFLSAQSSRFSFNEYINNDQDTLNYRLLNPDANLLRKFPLVIFLHGAGERGNNNQSQLKWGVMNFATDQAMSMHPAFVMAPQCPENMDWSNFKNDEKTKELKLQTNPSQVMELVIQLIYQLVENHPIDTSRIYITGLSSGAFGTFDAITRYPNLFAAAVPVCGYGDISKAASIAHIPIWVFQGSEDPVLDPIIALNMVEALKKAGAHPGITLYPGAGHFSWLAAYSDPLMIQWLFKQHK